MTLESYFKSARLAYYVGIHCSGCELSAPCSVDGLHKVDVANYIKLYPKSAMATLVSQGVSYPNSQVIPPSDSFPGLLAFFTGDPFSFPPQKSVC